jgi:hypothetical protein
LHGYIYRGAARYVDLWLYQWYTANMKTAIFLPGQVFYEAEETACYMGIP